MTCKFCNEFWDRFWAHSDAWEKAASNEAELFPTETEQNDALISSTLDIEDSDPEAAFRMYVQAAEAGSVWSMQRVGWHYWTGTGVAADLHAGLEYYRRAICEGSWSATIPYARLAHELGQQEDCEEVLEDGVTSDFVPAYFWLA